MVRPSGQDLVRPSGRGAPATQVSLGRLILDESFGATNDGWERQGESRLATVTLSFKTARDGAEAAGLFASRRLSYGFFFFWCFWL